MQIPRLVALLGFVSFLVVSLSDNVAYASCSCDNPVEVLCTTYAPPCLDASPAEQDAGYCGQRCCEFCWGTTAAQCGNCSSVADAGQIDAAPDTDSGSDGCEVAAGSGDTFPTGASTMICGLILLARFRSRKRCP